MYNPFIFRKKFVLNKIGSQKIGCDAGRWHGSMDLTNHTNILGASFFFKFIEYLPWNSLSKYSFENVLQIVTCNENSPCKYY